MSVVLFDVVRAEHLIAEYQTCGVSRDEIKARLITLFGLEDSDAETLLCELDNES